MAYPLSTQESSLRFAVPRSLAICGRATLTTNRSRLASTTPADTMASTSPGAAVGVAPGAAVLAALPRRVRSVIELTVTTASSIKQPTYAAQPPTQDHVL